MYGMSSIEFWEGEPKLYWAYRFSYLKRMEVEQQIEVEKMRQSCWLQGKINEIAFEVALNNCLSKKKVEFPSFERTFKEEKIKNEKIYNDLKEQLEGVTDEDLRQQIEFNYWARL